MQIICSRQITMPAPHHSLIYRTDDALSDAQPTTSKYWDQSYSLCVQPVFFPRVIPAWTSFRKGNLWKKYHNYFAALFPGPPGWAGARGELLDFMVQGKINRGRHADHPAGRHSIRTNQCLHCLRTILEKISVTIKVKCLQGRYPFSNNTHTRSHSNSHFLQSN